MLQENASRPRRPVRKRLFALLALTALLLGGLWYARPVGIHELEPRLGVTELTAVIDRFGPDGQVQLRSVQLELGESGFDAVTEAVESLRFRRSPLNPLRSLLPDSDAGREAAPGDWNFSLRLYSGDEQALCLQFFIDRWSYSGAGGDRYLPVSVSGQEASHAGQALSALLWELGVPVEEPSAGADAS